MPVDAALVWSWPPRCSFTQVSDNTVLSELSFVHAFGVASFHLLLLGMTYLNL